MNERNFSRRRRGMRFRPSGGLANNPKKPDRAAQEARAEAIGEAPTENVYERNRFSKEIERAENIATTPTASNFPRRSRVWPAMRMPVNKTTE